jgi:hypothetical protein
VQLSETFFHMIYGSRRQLSNRFSFPASSEFLGELMNEVHRVQ